MKLILATRRSQLALAQARAWYASLIAARPGRPVGGEAQTIRTLLAWLERRFG